MFGIKPYNYETFTRDMVVKDLAESTFVGGPAPGARAPDFQGRTLQGDDVRLGDFRGTKNVVLTFGSVTCPMTAGSIRGLNELYREYQGEDVQFLFVYVREAHPGDELPAHRSMDDKAAAAELLRQAEEVDIPILVDDLRGSIHRKYGKLPNPTYIIDKSGRVAFRCLWTQPGVVEEALRELLERQQERDVEHAVVHGGEHTSFPVSYSMLYTHRALERGGNKSITDFQEALGLPGRVTLLASRVAEPIALHPGKALAGALIAGGVITGALIAGRKLRQQRVKGRRPPYGVGYPERRTGTAGDYEAVGI